MNTFDTDKKNLKENEITEKEKEVNHIVTIREVQDYINTKCFQDVKLYELDNIEFDDKDFNDTVKTLAKYKLAKNKTGAGDVKYENFKKRIKARVFCWKKRQNISQDIENLEKGQRICYVIGENNNPNFQHITCIIVYKDNNGDVYEFDIGNSENKLLSCILNKQIKSSYRIYLQKSPFNCSVFACKAIKTLTPYAISNILQNKDKKDFIQKENNKKQNNGDSVLTDNHINQKYLPLKLLKYSEFGVCDTIKNLEERFNYKDKNVQKIINQILVNAKLRKNKYVNKLASLFKHNKLQPKKYKTQIKQPDTGLSNITSSYNKLNQFV